MVRALCLLLAVSACSSVERVPITAKVMTLGYSHPPAVVIVGRGSPDVVEAWVGGLRASKAAIVVGELGMDDPENPAGTPQLCNEALEVAGDTPIDEVLVITAVQTATSETGCTYSSVPGGGCTAVPYLGQRVLVSTSLAAYRASSCKLLRSTALPVATGASAHRDPIVPAAEGEDGWIEAAKETDLDEAHAAAVTWIAERATNIPWSTFPRDSSIQLVEGHKMLVAGPLAVGEYKLKQPDDAELHDGVRVVSSARNLTTLEFDPEHEPAAGDELYRVTDMGRVAAYTALRGGTVLAGGSQHILAAASLAVRYSREKAPWMGEIAIDGELVPGVDTQRGTLGGAFGLRWPNKYISPVVFGELGCGVAHQGNDGARSVVGYAGAGAGLELWFESWFLFADLRRRWTAMSDWEDAEENKVVVKYTDRTWTMTHGQIGFGKNF